MARLALKPDACGRRGQLSLVADYFEWRTFVRRTPLTLKGMADFLGDRELEIPAFRLVPLHEGGGLEEVPLASVAHDHNGLADERRRRLEEDALRVAGLLEERARYLGAAYPFRYSTSELSRPSQKITAYDVALALTLRHALDGDTTSAAPDFESFIARCLEARLPRVFEMAASIRAASGAGAARFRDVHRHLVACLGLGIERTAQIPEAIHDGGGDVIGRWEPLDDRPGCRTLLVQATIGPLGTWASKANLKLNMWRGTLGDPVLPLVTLAVPHHVERHYLHDLVLEGHGMTIYDRLRLVAHGPKVTRSDERQIQKLAKRGVEW